MNITFLRATDGTELTKRFGMDNGRLVQHSYPHVRNFTSQTVTLDPRGPVKSLHRHLKQQAAKYACLLKGNLKRELVGESRAQQTEPNDETRWICLDIDGLPSVKNAEQFVPLLPPEFQNVSYVSQVSSSMGVDPDKGYSAHLFFLLREPVLPAMLKLWLTQLNLSVPSIRSYIHLNKIGSTLKWPVDITTCQNDKLLYIAPPICEKGVKDSFRGERIQYAKRKHNFVELDLTGLKRAQIDHNRLALFNERRKEANLPQRRAESFKIVRGEQILKKPGTASVSERKAERGFIYYNLEGGDSWGYYHPEDNPEILFNFKGEPSYLFSELCPEEYAIAKKHAEKLRANNTEQGYFEEAGIQYFAVADKRSDLYYRGHYEPESGILEIFSTKSRDKLKDYLKEHGQPVPDFIPSWDIVYDFTSDVVFDPQNKVINRYQPTPYIKNAKPSVKLPLLCGKLIEHTLGGDSEAVDHFLNWLAVIVQKRIKTGTAWVLTGTQGTGKGRIFHWLLKPILGDSYASIVSPEYFEHQFNEKLESSLLLYVDEVDYTTFKRKGAVGGTLKMYITEPNVDIRRMHAAGYNAPSPTNFIFSSNTLHALHVDDSDRRLNIPPRQDTKLEGVVMTRKQIAAVQDEVQAFANYLFGREADVDRAGTVITSDEKDRLKSISRTVLEDIIHNLKEGNLEYFLRERPDVGMPPEMYQFLDLPTDTPTYFDILAEAFQHANSPVNIPRDHLRVLFFHIAKYNEDKARFSKMLSHRRIKIETIWHNSRAVQGVKGIIWKVDDDLRKEWQELLKARKPTVIRGGKGLVV